MTSKSKLPLILLSGVILISGCKKQEITYYEIPKEPVTSVAALPAGHPSVAQSPQGGASGMGALPGFSAATDQTDLVWQAPETWVTGAASSVRIASFQLEGVGKSELDVSVTRFPGDVGGMFSNVNRWRGQLGLAGYSDPAQAEADAELLQNDAFQFHVFRMSNDAQPAMATEVAILELNGFSWFFKVTGVKNRVDAESAHFREFLLSIKPGASQS